METKEKLIQHLKIENDELKEIVFKSFDTMEELREYKKTNKHLINTLVIQTEFANQNGN